MSPIPGSIRTIRKLLTVSGVVLLAINLLGLSKSLRYSDLHTFEADFLESDVEISYREAKAEIERTAEESDKAFALRINDVVYRAMLYYWGDEEAERFNLTVPIWENYLLALRNRLEGTTKYEFYDYEKNLERGVGLCSTYSVIVKGILERNGIEARLWGLTKHVVVEAKLDGEWYVLDPNYGVHIPYSMQEIQANPEVVRPIYRDLTDMHVDDPYKEPYTADLMEQLYGSEECHTYSPGGRFERWSYKAIWALPVVFLLAGTPSVVTVLEDVVRR